MKKKIPGAVTALLAVFLFTGTLFAQPQPDGGDDSAKKDALSRLSFYQDNYFITGFKYGFKDINTSDDKDNQVKFQFSIKYLLDWDVGNWLTSDFFNLYFIYTQKHFWNIYDTSSPFKEINFAPGVMFNFNFDMMFFSKIDFTPILHESNGRDGPADRSWNRIILNIGLIKFRYFALEAAGFYIYPFNKSNNNDDIEKYSGYFEALAKISDNIDDPVFQLDYRLKAAEKGLSHTVDMKLGIFYLINESFPKDVVLHVQFHYGYMESLETFNQESARIRVGIGLN